MAYCQIGVVDEPYDLDDTATSGEGGWELELAGKKLEEAVGWGCKVG